MPDRPRFLPTTLFAALVFFLSGCHSDRPAAAPVAYLVVDSKPFSIKLGWFHQIQVDTVLAIHATDAFDLPAGTSAQLVKNDGSITAVAGPRTLAGAALAGADTPSRAWLGADLNSWLTDHPAPPVLPPDAVALTSPAGATRWLEPIFTWVGGDSHTFDVAVFDPTDPLRQPRVAHGVHPPVPFSRLTSTQNAPLVADRIFQVGLRQSDQPTVLIARPFLVSPDADTSPLPVDPAARLLEAVRALTSAPPRTGDAWLMLADLPANWSGNELAVRLRLRLATELALPSTYAAALADAQKLPR